MLLRLLAASARKAGNAARDRGDLSGAIAAYRRYLGFRPEDGAIHVQLGHMLKEGGDLAAAADAYDAAHRIDPADPDALIWIGDLHRRAGRLDEARARFADSAAIDGNPAALRDLAEMDERIAERDAERREREAAERRARDAAAEAQARLRREAEERREREAEAARERERRREAEAREAAERAAAEREAAEARDRPPPAPRWVGEIDIVRGPIVSGWAVDPARPGEPVDVYFHVGDTPIGEARADIARPDLTAIGGHGFRAHLDLADRTGALWIEACLRDTGEPLRGSPFRVDRAPAAERAPLAATARFEVVKPLALAPGEELALFVTHSRTGAVKPHVAAHVRALAAEGIVTLMIVVADRPADIATDLLSVVAGAIVRENRGFDFACWAHALRLYPQAYAAPILYLVNDSIFGPPADGRFAAMIARVRASPADLVALTESHDHRWHAQSYFLALKPGALGNLQLHFFMGGVRILDSKDAVIRAYECTFAATLENAGCRVDILFPSFAVANPTLFGWRALLDNGFPYVKLLLLRGDFPHIETDGWRDELARHGFDIRLLDAALATGAEGWEPAADHPLLARPHRRAPHRPEPTPAQPLRIAFFGPWNYDNGLGAASRGLIAAIRRCGVQLNLHPIAKPFHIHRPLAPAVDVTDFVGPADIAVIHLNPDSWHLLTDDQRALIAAARKRIGYWVWEMAHIPPAWRHEFSSVDRIWAPSGYCAALFAAEREAPVDIVPHCVPLPRTRLSAPDRRRMLAGLGLPPRGRVILYAFDGSSYLVRKNPAALVRAFAESRLADRGWSLVLKTKHLFDRAEEGRALAALVAETAHVVLLDAAMPATELARLVALADIYASPHCSEGFGLTIAEAMAAAKPVVATDFGGSTDFLDATCGYPVPAHPWRLEEDHGHYTKGGEWAAIDEPALAATLRRAAAAIEAGDTSVGEAARHRVAGQLSYEAVARVVAASFAAVLADASSARPAPPIEADLSRGIRFDEAVLGEGFVAVPLASDLAPPAAEHLRDLPADRQSWLVFAPGDGLISPAFRHVLTDFLATRPGVDLLYADDIALGEARLATQLRLKPAFDFSMLAARDYVGAPLIVRASAFRALGGFDPLDGEASLGGLLFRAHAQGLDIRRISATLLAWRGRRPVMPRAAWRAMLAGLPAFAGLSLLDGLAPDTIEIKRPFTSEDAPEVTIVIPTRRAALPGSTYIERLLEALATTNWPMSRLRVLVGDDHADRPAWADTPRPYALEWIATPRDEAAPFNYAAKINRLWRAATTEHMVLMNDDVLPLTPAWLAALMTFAVEESVGGVGARLLYEDGGLQHAGIAPLFDLIAHAWLGCPSDAPTFQDWAIVQREWSMVTGAVFATRRAALEQVDGFDERFALEFNDVDLCLRLRALGFRIVYTPHAELRHAEKASRGHVLPPGPDIARFIGRWRDWLADDPTFHPLLRHDSFDIAPRADPDAWYL